MAKAEVVGACVSSAAEEFIPIYEAKMIHQFDHRWATYVDAPDKPDGLDTNDVSPSQQADPAFTVRPRYWLEEAEVLARIARVPSRVANAWLAWRKATTPAEETTAIETQKELADSRAALTLALASWVAGALFLREAEQAVRIEASTPTPTPRMQEQTGSLFGDPEPQVSGTDKPAHPWSNQVAADSTNVVERLMTTRYPVLADALKGAGTVGKKALPAFTKWALQDPAQGLGLSDDELDTLQTLQAPAATSHSATKSGAVNANFTGSRGQFGLDFSWLDAWMDRRSPRWLMGWRDITNATNERTVIASVIPRSGTDFTVRVCLSAFSCTQASLLLANMNSIVLDYVCRQKIGGTHLADFIAKQLPVLPPDRYTDSDQAYIVPRVLELTHTAHDMQAWADDLAAYDPRPADQRQIPFPWNPERRAQLRAELDATYARLYGLTRDELRYILDPAEVMGPDYPSETFRVLQKNEMKAFGEYRTQRLVLKAWDQQSAALSQGKLGGHG